MATEPDTVNSGALGTLTALAVLFMIGTCLGVVACEVNVDVEVEATDATAQLSGVVKKQEALLKAGAGIESHMKAVAQELRRNPDSASPPAPPPPAPKAPAPAPGQTAAPTPGEGQKPPAAAEPLKPTPPAPATSG